MLRCGACFDPVEGIVSDSTKQEIGKLIEEDKLRLAHDFPKSGYGGYIPRLSYGVSLAKVNPEVVHPFLSVTQAITQRYAEDKTK